MVCKCLNRVPRRLGSFLSFPDDMSLIHPLEWPLENLAAGLGFRQTALKGMWALIDAPLIPAGFQSFLRIPVPFQWNLPAKISKYWYSGTYTGTVPRMDRNGMALECMTGMDAKNCQIRQVLHIHTKNTNKITKEIRDGAHYWWWCWGTDYMVCAHYWI